MGWKVAAYLRVSSDIQADRNGTAAQREGIARWVEYHKSDIEAVTWHEDLAVSGAVMDRPQFQAMMQSIEAGDVDTVVAYDLSRVGRNTRGVLEFVETCARKGVRFVSLKEQIDMGTAMGRFFLTILSAMNELQRNMIAERARDGMQRKARTGARLGIAQKRPEYNVPSADVQQQIAREYAGGTPVAELVAKYGVLRRQVYRYAVRFGFMQPPMVKPQDRRKAPRSLRGKRGPRTQSGASAGAPRTDASIPVPPSCTGTESPCP